MKRKFNKKLLTFGLLGIFALALVTGALLTYYGQIKQQVIVEQGLTVDGNNWNEVIIEDPVTMYSLETKMITSGHYLDNQADVPAIQKSITSY